MNVSSKEKIYLILLAIIFGAGFIIYGWNLLRGRDVSKPPQIDFSQFEFKMGDDKFGQKK